MSELLFGCRAGPPADALRAMAWLAVASRRRRLVNACFRGLRGAHQRCGPTVQPLRNGFDGGTTSVSSGVREADHLTNGTDRTEPVPPLCFFRSGARRVLRSGLHRSELGETSYESSYMASELIEHYSPAWRATLRRRRFGIADLERSAAFNAATTQRRPPEESGALGT
jgi:hypothetical protein